MDVAATRSLRGSAAIASRAATAVLTGLSPAAGGM